MAVRDRRGGIKGRVRRKPLLFGVLAVAVIGGLLVFVSSARPAVEVLNAVPLERGFVGTTYAFDGLVCVGSQVTSTTVTGVEIEQADGSTTKLVLPPADDRPTVGFPVDPDAGEPVDGYVVPAGEPDCGFRLLVTPDRTGDVQAGSVRLATTYGPGGVLRRTLEATTGITLEVTGTGTDPRSTA